MFLTKSVNYLNLRTLSGNRIAPLLSRFYSSPTEYDTVVIGAGPGGYTAAIKSAQFGAKTACVEMGNTLGGTCLNVGCIPSKSLLHNTHYYSEAKNGFKKRGIEVEGLSVNFKQLMKAKDDAVRKLTGGIEYLFKKNKVDWVKGKASFASPNELSITNADGSQSSIKAKNFIIATGSVSSDLPGIEVDEKQIVSSTGALALEKIPKSMVVIGAGVIGLELGSVYSRLGSKVTAVEFLPEIGAGMDSEIS
ncbi:hypothetical protein BB560_006448 [Smittium megazygosporum]|uniref:FAD/NAD(P)-binding domain-containing protein n=1 Tax=Smittium megazygosporum TaxID=133381 RepID=A0A2T9Y5Y5_9FUNG|nr:hypothetical protein BB560_006448 [Smittium megazygosporum]